MSLQFTWDENKAQSNFLKHRVSFEEAGTVFFDPLGRIFDDEDHSEFEQREILIGHSLMDRLLIVSFTEPEEDQVRIISARCATRKEREDYEENS
jgi:uncharacterized protein